MILNFTFNLLRHFGHYFSPDINTAKEYGDIIKKIKLETKDFLNWDKLTDEQATKIGKELKKVVPSEKLMGYAKHQKKYFTKDKEKGWDEAETFFEKKNKEAENYYHDRSKPQIDKDEKGIFVGYVDENDINIDKSQMKYLMQEYDQDIARRLNYKGARNGNEVVIYDTDLVNKNISDKAKELNGLSNLAQKRVAVGLPERGGKAIFHPDRNKNYFYHPESDTVYFKRGNGQWKEMPNEQLREEIKYIDKNGAKSFTEKNIIEDKQFEKAIKKNDIQKIESYKDQHTAPTRDQDGTASIDDLTAIYPADIYNANAARMYGHNEKAKDDIAMYILRKIKGNPDAKVTIYRAIPQEINAEISSGDWVTITKQYAIEHGNARFDGKYKMLSKEVKAKDIITDGNSIHEQGYDPK